MVSEIFLAMGTVTAMEIWRPRLPQHYDVVWTTASFKILLPMLVARRFTRSSPLTITSVQPEPHHLSRWGALFLYACLPRSDLAVENKSIAAALCLIMTHGFKGEESPTCMNTVRSTPGAPSPRHVITVLTLCMELPLWTVVMKSYLDRERGSPHCDQAVLTDQAHGRIFFTSLKTAPRLITGLRKPWPCNLGSA